MSTNKQLHRSTKGRIVTTIRILSVFAVLFGLAACSVSPQEEPILRMEQYLEQLESDWNSGISRQSPADEAMDLKGLYEAVRTLDPAVLDRELEIRRTRVLGEADLYLMVLVDEALSLPAGTDVSSQK